MSPSKATPDSPRQLPQLILHRAANLLSSKGQSVVPVQETAFGDPVPRPAHGRKLSEGSIGASIKRSLESVKNVPRGLGLTRSRSTTTPRGASLHAPQASGHRRANSEHLSYRPVFSYTLSPPADNMDDVLSTRSFTRTMYEDSQPSSSDHDSVEHQQPTSSDPSSDEAKVPVLLLHGTPLLKVSAKKVQTRLFKLDPDQGQILWESKKSGISMYGSPHGFGIPLTFI